MVKKVLTLLFASVLVFGLSAPVFAQEGPRRRPALRGLSSEAIRITLP